MSEDRIDSIIDLQKVQAEIDTSKQGIKELVALIQSVKGKSIEVSSATTLGEYKKLNAELGVLIKQTDLSAKSAINEAKAREASAKATAAEAKASEQLTKQKIAEEKLRQANAAAAEKEANAAKKKAEADAASAQATNAANQQSAKAAQLADNARLAKEAQVQAEIDAARSIEAQTAAQEELNAAMQSAAASGNQRAQLVTDPAPIKAATQSVTVYKDELEKLTGTIEENQKLHSIYTSELEDVDHKLKILKTTTDNSAKGSAKYQAELAGLTTRQKQLKTDISDVNRVIGLQVKENNSAAGSIDQLRARYALLLKQVEQGGTAFKASGPGKLIAAETVLVKTALDKAERDALLFRGSLSNVGSAIADTGKKAFGFIRQAANIIPGLGLSGAFLLIFEGLTKIIELFSKTDKELNILKESQKELNEAMNDNSYQDAIKNVQELKIEIGLAKDGFIDKDKVVKHYNETIGKTTGEVKSLDEAESELNANAEAYIKFTLLKAAANIALSKAAKEAVKQAEDQQAFNEDLIKATKDRPKAKGTVSLAATDDGEIAREGTEAANRVIKERNKAKEISDKRIKGFQDIAANFLTDAALISDSLNFDFFGGKGDKNKDKNAKFFDDILKLQRDAFLEISKDENIFLQERITAREKAALIDKVISEGKRRVDVANAKGNAEDIKNINDLARAQELKAEQDKNKDILKLQDKFTKDLIDNNIKGKELIAKSKETTSTAEEASSKSQHETELQNIQNAYDAEILALDNKFAKGRIKEKEYADAKLKIQLQAQKDLLSEDIKFTKETLQLAEARAISSGNQEDIDAVESAKSKLAALELKLLKLTTDATIDSNKKKKQSDKDRHDATVKQFEQIAQISSEVFSIASNFAGIRAENEKNRIQEQIDLLEKQKQKDIEVANQTIANAQDRAAAITVIEARANAQREQLEIRKRQADERKAKFDKAASIAGIIVNTALAVVKALPNIPLAVIIAALGAAQLAVAVATPIPKYRHGTDNHKGGLMIVGDGGRSEGIELPDGTVMKTPSVPTLMDAPKGTKVHKDYSSMMLKATITNVPVYKEVTRSDKAADEIKIMKRDVVTAIKKIPQPIVRAENIISRTIRRGGSNTTIIGNA